MQLLRFSNYFDSLQCLYALSYHKATNAQTHNIPEKHVSLNKNHASRRFQN